MRNALNQSCRGKKQNFCAQDIFSAYFMDLCIIQEKVVFYLDAAPTRILTYAHFITF
jgi:hypothetical protein